MRTTALLLTLLATPALADPGRTALVEPEPAAALLQSEQNTIDVFQAAAPATVFVSQDRLVRDRYMRLAEVPAGSGTGFLWDDRGHVVTNYHVIASRERTNLEVTLMDGRSFPATVVGVEPRKDIAVLRIEAEGLTAIRLPAKGAVPQVGQKAIAIGNPFALDHTLTTGVISAMGREVHGIGGVTIRDMIQTDAAINPGNSGGPLLDSRGQLLGMNTMIFSQSGSSAGIGFAVPVQTIRRVVPQIIEKGHADQIGIGVTLVDDLVARRNGIAGVVIREVLADSPAARAGLRGLVRTGNTVSLGDIIVGIDSAIVRNFDDLYNTLDQYEPGATVQVTVVREGRERTVPVKLVVLEPGG